MKSFRRALDSLAGRSTTGVQDALNAMAGTTGKSRKEAANTYAGTTGKTVADALATKAGVPYKSSKRMAANILNGTAAIQPKYTLNFSAAGSQVVIPSHSDLKPSTTNKFSWCMWIYPFSTNNNVLPRLLEIAPQYMCIMGDQNNGRKNQIAIEIQNNSGSTTTEYWGSTRLVPNKWYHVVGTFNDATGKIYVNGIAETMTTLLGPYASPLKTESGNMYIGQRTTGSRNFDGLIGGIKIYNRDLTAQEVVSIYRGDIIDDGLVAYLPTREGSGATVEDIIGGHNGTITNATWKQGNNI